MHPVAVKTALQMFFAGYFCLAFRWWRYFFIHVALVINLDYKGDQSTILVFDEGMPKKLYDAVPCPIDDDDAVKKTIFWRRFNTRFLPGIVDSLSVLTNIFVYLYLDGDALLTRMKLRDPEWFNEMGVSGLGMRYKLQEELYMDFLETAKKEGFITHVIDSGDMDDAI